MFICVDEEGRRSVGRVKNDEVLRRVKEERNILHKIKRRQDTWIGGLVTSYVRAAFSNTSLKKRQKGQGYEEEDEGSYWMILR
jgi:hypothetical protein